MTDMRDDRVGDDPIYEPKLAPAHLMTRRQLRAAGLRPNGQPIAGWVPVTWRGRTTLARLFDRHKAAPKRDATPAQRQSAINAALAHRAHAAARHGLAPEDLHTPVDPGLGWTDPTTHKEENTMSDTTSQGRDPDALQLGTPTGHGQRIAHLLAVVAVNQARERHDRLDAAVEQAESGGPEAVAQLDASLRSARDAAEARLAANTAVQGPASVAALADALVYRTGSASAESRLDRLISDYADDWGVVIDPEELTVTIDPQFDAVAAQTRTLAFGLFDRESYAVDIVTAMPMQEAAKTAVTDAVLAWSSKFNEPGLGDWLDTEGERRGELGAALAAAKLDAGDQARVEFVVDFLRGDVGETDLLASPVFVDPGEEVRSRIPELLRSFAKTPEAAKFVGEEISVMTEADQERVRAAGKAIAHGEQVDMALWPGYVDRGQLEEALDGYRRDVQELRMDADALAEGNLTAEERDRLGLKSERLQDETAARIDDIAAGRDKLLATARDGLGLASIERAHLTAVVEDIAAGRTELPELLFADEHTKCDADFLRRDQAAALLAAAAKKAITQQIDATAAVDPNARAAEQVGAAVDSIAETLGSVAGGSRVTSRGQDRVEYREQRGRLGQALAQAGVTKDARVAIGAVLDEHAHKAGEVGAHAIDRRDQWNTKIAQAAAIRDDAIAQREAVEAGRTAPSEAGVQRTRACTARIDTALATAQTQAPARIRQLHSMEVER